MPIPSKDQKDLDVKRDSKDGLAEVRAGIRQLLSAWTCEGYFTCEMGLTSRNKLDIQRPQGEIRALKDRVDDLEPQI